MENRVLIQRDQQITSEDLTNMGVYPTDSLDLLVKSAIEPGLKYAGFNVIESGPGQVLVGDGVLFQDGRRYLSATDAGTTIDMITNLPALANRYVAIVAFGNELDTQVEPRTFLLDPVTRETEARAIATTRTRVAQIDKALGTESTAPLPPQVAAGVAILALVLLSPTGIVSITQNTDNKLSSARDNANALLELGIWRAQTGAKLETIQTDITGLSDNARGSARIETVLEIARDVSQLKQISGLPATYSSYGTDPFLSMAQSDTDINVVTGGTTNPLLDCNVQEGLRFPLFAQATAQLNLLNSDDVKVRKQDNFIMPAFTEVERITSIGRDDEISLAQYENQTIEMVQKTVSRQRVRYGGYFTVCTNSAWWRSGKYDPASGIFSIEGASYTVDIAPFQEGWVDLASNHTMLRLQQFWVDTLQESYWDAIVENTSINGSVVAQTFLNSQESWITAIGLYFTRKGNANVNVAICETTSGGAPDLQKVVARTTLNVADIQVYPLQTKVPLPLTLLERGKRYAIVPISTGSHYLALTVGNKFNQGSLFYSTDGSWFQGDLIKDLAFVLFAAKFNTPRVEVQLESWELAGGIFAIDLLADAVIPSGTTLSYDVRINNVWVPLSGADLNSLASLPPLLQARAVFQGTTDLMPRLGVGSRGRVLTERPKQAFLHISRQITPPVPVNTVWVDVRMESFDAAHNTAVVKLRTGAGFATVTTASVITTIPDPDGVPGVVHRRYVFALGATVPNFKIQTEGTTDALAFQFHVALRQYVALNV